MAQGIYRVEVRNGESTSFRYEVWSPLGCLRDFLQSRGCTGIGIPMDSMVSECRRHKKRRHRDMMLNKVEEEIERYKEKWSCEKDISLWKNEKGKYKKSFSTKGTWLSIREKYQECHWHKAVWFKGATPKFAFIVWIAIQGRLSTGERMKMWNENVDTTCVLCQEPLETRDHLFFECSYSKQIWENLMKGVMRDRYTTKWDEIVEILTKDAGWGKMELFIARYIWQSAIHAIWRERNGRKHDEPPRPMTLLIKHLDKNMRNRITIQQRKGDKNFDRAMVAWFATR